MVFLLLWCVKLSVYSIDTRELRFSRAMVFAIEEINNSTKLLPAIRLGYQIHDSCASVVMAARVAFQLSNVNIFTLTVNCGIQLDKRCFFFQFAIKEIHCFVLTIPSDQFQADALAKLVKHFGWTWIGAVRSDSEYGNNGMASFLDAAHKEGICVEYSESFYRTDPHLSLLMFASSGDLMILFEELTQKPSPPRQWIGSESWITNPDMLRFTLCAGAIGFGIQQSVIPGLRDFLLDLSPIKVSQSPVLAEFWEDAFNCRLGKSETIMLSRQSPYTDTSQLRITNMVYKAVYAIAHAIHNTVCQKTNSTTHCDKLTRIESKQVLAQLKKVNFSQNGYDVSFDANGDPVARYELVNWQKSRSGSIELVTVGLYDASLPVGQEFHINKNLTWVEDSTQVPSSVCSDSCPPGTRKVLQKGKPICCYDCIPCPEGEISNATDSPDCFPCPKEFWPNAERNICFPKPVEFLSYNEVLGIILAAFSVGGACLAVITAAVFFHHRTSPIVRANNSELSFLLLFSLTLCFLCALTFIGTPSEWSCMLRHTAFGITFVLCISCVLGKTIVVLMAFKATLPGSNVMKWFGPPQQRMTVVSFTFIQVLICTIWLVLRPPFPMKNLTIYKERIILECALGSVVGFWAVLGYIGLLAVFCFVLAVLARKLPDNFNEAKLITFSMLIFCAVWITFIPAYVSSPGKFTVAVEIFAILASSFGLILCIFAPKCFIILFKPEKNTKKHLMNKNQY
uniref:G-protein coupled receptors family 3 profile domain-containing protein n=1 Tax=Lates calcarifer TaxID=8187 RepID=A0A4W6C1G1_LATCA